LTLLQWQLTSLKPGGLARERALDAPHLAARGAGAVELLRSGRLAPDHPDWALGAGFSFTPQDGEGEGDPGEGAAGPGGAGAAAAPAPAAAASKAGGRHGAGAEAAAPDAGLGGEDGGGSGGGTGDAAAARARGAEGGLPQDAEGRAEGHPGPAVGVDLEHSFSLASADALATPFTNFVRGCAPRRARADGLPMPGHRPPHSVHACGLRTATHVLNPNPKPLFLLTNPTRAGTRAC
jgi:hypothetical protein